MDRIKLGQEVKDRVTGFTGIVISNTKFLNGCNRMEVQPKLESGKELFQSMMFDEPDLEIISDGVYKEEIKEKKPTHGNPDFRPSRMR